MEEGSEEPRMCAPKAPGDTGASWECGPRVGFRLAFPVWVHATRPLPLGLLHPLRLL